MHGPISLSNSTSTEESHRLIDEAIAQHQASILALMSQKNSLAPISRLPPELLCQIFLFRKTQARLEHRNQLPHSLKWIEVSHVCSRWRNVAINSPNFWVDLPIENLRWVQEMLQRSGNVGLVVDFDFFDGLFNGIPQGLELALNSMRVKHLSLRTIRYLAVWSDLQHNLLNSAPQLERLCLTMERYGWIRGQDRSIVLSGEVFCETKQLRHLELDMCSFDWDLRPSFLHSLTTLKLHNLALDSRPTVKQFVDALYGMHNLQLLDLKHAFPSERTSWSSNHVHLGSLHTLVIHSIDREVTNFLYCVTFSLMATVTITCEVNEDWGSDTDHSGAVLGLSRSYSNNSDAHFETLIFPRLPLSLYGFSLKLFRMPLEEEQMILQLHARTAQMQVTFPGNSNPPKKSTRYCLVSCLFSGVLPMHNITRIYLVGEAIEQLAQLDLEIIANTIGNLPQVNSIIVDRDSSAHFLKALQLGLHSGNAYFPRLSSIYFYRTKFWKPDEPEHMQDQKSISVESLRDCLAQRRDSGSKIDHLKFRCCHRLGKSDVDSLAQFVSTIEWDSLEHFGCSLSEDESIFTDGYSSFEDDDDEQDEE